MTRENVLLFWFPRHATAFEVLSKFKDEPAVRQAAVVERTATGHIQVADSIGATGSGAFTGGVVGALVGILLGPLGVLFGWGVGTLAGGASDVSDADDADDAIALLARRIQPGGNVLIAEVDESSPQVMDSVAGSYGGQLIRSSADEVMAEVQAQRDAQVAAARAAREEQRKERRADFRATLQAHLGHHHESGDTTSQP